MEMPGIFIEYIIDKKAKADFLMSVSKISAFAWEILDIQENTMKMIGNATEEDEKIAMLEYITNSNKKYLP